MGKFFFDFLNPIKQAPAAAPLLRQRQPQKVVRRCSLVCANAAVPKQKMQ